jgi:hypothetical protein
MAKKQQNGIVGELMAAKELVTKGFRVYFPHQGNTKDDDLVAVNKKSGNVYRIQVKTKKDLKKWSAIYFKKIKEQQHKSFFYILLEREKDFYIVPSKALANMDAEKSGFENNSKYRDKWDLLK